MTRDFAMIAYSSNRTPLSCEFTVYGPPVSSSTASIWGTWHHRGLAHTNYGPQPFSPPLPPAAPDPNPSNDAENEYNQCVFIRYYTVRWRFPKVIKAAAGPHVCGSGNNHGETSKLAVQSGTGPHTVSRSGNSMTDHSSLVTTHEPELKIFHNFSSGGEDTFDIIARYVFQNSKAEAVLLHHRDIAQMREGMPEAEMSELLFEREPLIMVDGAGVGKLVHQWHQQLALTLLGAISPSPVVAATQLGPPSYDMVLSQWQRLGSLDPRSRDYTELFRTLVDVESNREVALGFIHGDAEIVINHLGKVSSSGIIDCFHHA
ncbi:hypothetical protein BDM02DRAFT_2477188 [Thelephora ganbajun]|uniref:Uncharacterized protein n=1 Tax=Thelephora ganbajun TaxID=370292 RepID=A0ACB6YY46_THEGA|nr:hypothetical protein BDM02DRAFT_2477188 [Thelephora ganbajun]